LGVKVPNEPIPRENTGGDKKYWDLYFARNASQKFSVRYYSRTVPIYILSMAIVYLLPLVIVCVVLGLLFFH